MATFVKYEIFATDLANGIHDLSTSGSQLKIALTNTAPNVSGNQFLSDVTQISYTNITETMPADVTNVGTQNGGTFEVSGTDITLNATGAVATFRYVVLYNDTPSSPKVDPLIGYWDYGSGITMASGETFTVDFGSTIFTVT